jgi:hypothetical protein
MTVDLALAAGAILFAGGLAILTIRFWRAVDRWAARRRLNQKTPDIPAIFAAAPAEPQTCGVPTFGTERCGLLAGHADRRHLSWPSGQPYPPDDDDTQPIEIDPPVVPRERLNAVGGWVQVGSVKVHRSCNEARRDGRYDRICAYCRPRLAMPEAVS